MILESDAGRLLFITGQGKSGSSVKNLHMEAGGRGKGISLDMVNR